MARGHEVIEFEHVELQRGGRLPHVQLAFRTFGTLAADASNVVVIPSYYTGSHRETANMVAPDRALDPSRYFIVAVNLLGNAVSSSPSNTPAPCGGADFPLVTVADNVRLQRRLLHERWGIDRVALVVGWSMGAQQCFEWACSEPDSVAAIAPICGSARTSPHNKVFLEGVKAALQADPAFAGGRYASAPIRGLQAFGKVYAGWAYSQAFFRNGVYRELGCASLDDVLDRWAQEHTHWDANDLLAMLATWYCADISDNTVYGGDFERALGAITARAIVMPCSNDLYFPTEDSRYEVAHMPNARLHELVSDWGHIAGSPLYDAASSQAIDAALGELLAAASA